MTEEAAVISCGNKFKALSKTHLSFVFSPPETAGILDLFRGQWVDSAVYRMPVRPVRLVRIRSRTLVSLSGMEFIRASTDSGVVE